MIVKKSKHIQIAYFLFILITFNFRLLQYQIALQTSKDRLKMFCDQLNSQLKNKQLLTALLSENEKRIIQLKTNLSNLGVQQIIFMILCIYIKYLYFVLILGIIKY